MERWAESHPPHVEIFGRSMRAVQKLEFNLALRLCPEVIVAAPAEQFLEYVQCHDRTGMLTASRKEGSRPIGILVLEGGQGFVRFRRDRRI